MGCCFCWVALFLLLTILFTMLQSTVCGRDNDTFGSTWTVRLPPFLACLAQSPTLMYDCQKVFKYCSSWVCTRLQLVYWKCRVHSPLWLATLCMSTQWIIRWSAPAPETWGMRKRQLAATPYHAFSCLKLYSGVCMAPCTRTTERTLRG